MYTLPVALATFATGQYQADHGMLMAGLGRARRARADRVRALPALDHRGYRDHRTQGLSRRRQCVRRRDVALPARRRGRVLALLAGPTIVACRRGRRSTSRPSRPTLQTRLDARDTWASFVAMTDPTVRSAGRQPVGRRDARASQTSTDEHRRLHVEHVVAEQLGIISHAEAVDRLDRRCTRSRRWSATSRRPVLQLVRPPHRREADDVAADRRAAHADPLVGRQRLARDRPEDRVASAVPEVLGAGARRSTTRWTSGSTTGPTVNRDRASTYAPVDGRVALLLRHHREREPDRELHRHREGRAPDSEYFGAVADVPGYL